MFLSFVVVRQVTPFIFCETCFSIYCCEACSLVYMFMRHAPQFCCCEACYSVYIVVRHVPHVKVLF